MLFKPFNQYIGRFIDVLCVLYFMRSKRILAGDFFAYILVFIPVYFVTGLIVIIIFFSLGELCTISQTKGYFPEETIGDAFKSTEVIGSFKLEEKLS